jgi:hypothetical protein
LSTYRIKKKKKKKGRKKDRGSAITFDFGKPVTPKKATRLGDKWTFYDERGKPLLPVQTKSTLFHERDSGKDKIIQERNASLTEVFPNTKAFFESYHSIFAIDTNSRNFGDHRLYATSCVLAQLEHLDNNDQESFLTYSPNGAVEWWDLPADTFERYGWALFLSSLEGMIDADSNMRFLVVVDSHKDSLSSINQRKEPIVADVFLPRNFELMYASADKKNDGIANRLIFEADKLATSLIKFISRDWKSCYSNCKPGTDGFLYNKWYNSK